MPSGAYTAKGLVYKEGPFIVLWLILSTFARTIGMNESIETLQRTIRRDV